jgi:hypothetical protein
VDGEVLATIEQPVRDGLGRESQRARAASPEGRQLHQATQSGVLRVLERKTQREGAFRAMKRRRAYEKPSERRARE